MQDTRKQFIQYAYAYCYCEGMTVKRRPRGTLVDPVQLGYPVERRNKERFASIARNANISAAALFDLLVENMPLDEHGYPKWLPEHINDKDAELPINTA